MKRITLVLLTVIASLTLSMKSNAQSEKNPYLNIKTITTVSTSANKFDTISLGTGYKSIQVKNTSGGILQVAFSNSDNKRYDTTQVYIIPKNKTYYFPYRVNKFMYVMSSFGNGVTYIIDYGFGGPVTEGSAADTNGTQLIINSADSVQYSGVSKAFFDTLTNTSGNGRVDTLSRMIISSASNTLFGTYNRYYFIQLITDDTLEISDIASFPSRDIWTVYPGTWTSGKYNVSQITNWYFRRKASTAAVKLAHASVKTDGY